MVDLVHETGGIGCDNRASGQRGFALVPDLPNAGKGDGGGIRLSDIPGQAFAVFILGPFVKPGCRDDAAAFAAGGAKGGFFGDGFGAGIDQQRAIGGGFVPMRQKPPAMARC